jgi:hypothetical protein
MNKNYKTRLKFQLKRKIYFGFTRTVSYAARYDFVRSAVQKIIRILVWSIRKETKLYLEYRAAEDLAQLLHESLAGRWIVASHGFGKVIGQSKAISFIFPYYKKEKEVINAIKTLKNQIFKKLTLADIEIIVVEDGSNDLLDEVLDDDVIYLRRNKFDYGISRSRNLGAKVANGRVLCFVDPDFEFPQNYIENLYEEYLKYGPETIITGYISDYFYEGCPDPRVAFGVWEVPDRKCSRFLQLAGGHMAISSETFFRVGGFDEDMIYGEVEDTYFGHLLSLENDLSIVFSSKVTVRHIPHPVGLAHRNPAETFRVAAFKSPSFYQTYVLDGKR